MAIYGSFMAAQESAERDLDRKLKESFQKCVDSAVKTIQIMDEAYSKEHFFQTW